jgi:DHA2 family multidrug resistance protein
MDWCLVLAMANFLAVLNMTIANVTQPNMAGALGAGTSQGTWIITAYAVAEAITVPLSGWLTTRFGGVRVFSVSVFMFGIFLCFAAFPLAGNAATDEGFRAWREAP